MIFRDSGTFPYRRWAGLLGGLLLLSVAATKMPASATGSAVSCRFSSADDLTPEQGEIGLWGTVISTVPGEQRAILSVTQVVGADGTVTPLSPPRTKSVLWRGAVRFVPLTSGDPIPDVNGLRPGVAVQTAGRELPTSAGGGLAARILAVDTSLQSTMQILWDRVPRTQPDSPSGGWLVRAKTPARASIAADSSSPTAVRILVGELGRNANDIQLMQLGLVLKEGDNCTVRFKAKADKTRVIPLRALAGTGDFHAIGLLTDVSLTEKWQPFTYAFTVKKPDPEKNLCPVLNLGDQKGIVSLDELSVTISRKKTKETGPKAEN